MLNNVMPTWKQILYGGEDSSYGFWNSENYIYTSSSGMSMRLIFNMCKESLGKNINILVPAYFCQDTLNSAYSEGIQYIYYSINYELSPDWSSIKILCTENQIDIFIFCHYFGIYQDVNRAKNFCTQKEIILIEDCAHVLYPGHRFGYKGDFVLFSPHKTLPVPDGGILYINNSKSNKIMHIQNAVKLVMEVPCNDKAYRWRLKKAIQKVIKYQNKIKVDFKPHYGKKNVPDTIIKNISKYSKEIICGYTLKMLKRAELARKDNQEILDFFMHKVDSSIEPFFRTSEGCPYYAVYSFKNVNNKQRIINILEKKKIMAQYWPDLPEEIKNKEFKTVRELAQNLVLIPNNQSIRTSQIAKLIPIKENISIEDISLCPVSNKNDEEKWKEITSKIHLTNIPQDWQYGNIKAEMEGWTVKRFIIIRGDQLIGTLQILIKKVMGIPWIIRINRGPLLISKFDNINTVIAVLNQLKRIYRFPILKVAALNIPFSAYNLAIAINNGWRQWNSYGFSSGIINLEQSEKDIRKNLNSKWRNQLVSSEKKHLILKTGKERFNEIVDIYENAQRVKKFSGIPTNILYGLFRLENSPLDILYIENIKSEIIAFDIFYSTDNFGLYLVGWNGEEGRKCYANNFLLYQAVLLFKKRGVKWFELGGIDYIETEENALFKSGMNPEMYRLLGEFYSF